MDNLKPGLGARSARFGLAVNRFCERYMSLLIPGSLILGFLLADYLQRYVSWGPYIFAYVTLIMALGCGPSQLRGAVRMTRPILLVFLLAHIIAPLIAYAVGTALFGEGSPYVIGFVLFTIIPLGISSVMWVGLSGGNVALALLLIVIDAAASPFIVPLEISLFFGHTVSFNKMQMMGDLMLIVVIPTFIGIMLHYLSKGRAKAWSAPVTGPTSKLAFVAVILINAVAIEPIALSLMSDMLIILPTVIVLVIFLYAVGYATALVFHNRATTVTLSFASGMRNISLGVVLAVGYFEPAAAVPVVLAILIQQPLASVMQLFLRGRFRHQDQTAGVHLQNHH